MVSESVQLPGDKKLWVRAGPVLSGHQASGPRPLGRLPSGPQLLHGGDRAEAQEPSGQVESPSAMRRWCPRTTAGRQTPVSPLTRPT